MGKVLNIVKWPWRKFKSLSLLKKIIIVVIVVIILAALNATIFANKESGYVIEPVERATISQTVSETGNVDTGATVEILSPSTGIVSDVFVKNGQQVLAGDILFTVESTATVQEQQQTYSNYLAAQAALNAANSTANTLRAAMYTAWDTFYNMATNSNYETDDGTPRQDERLAAEFQIAQDSWVAAEKQYKDQQTAIAQAQAQVSSTWLLYEATQNAEVRSTADGTIANLSVAKGSDITAQNETLIIIPGSDAQYVHLQISEIDVPKIREGQKVEIEIDAISDTVFNGTVDRVDAIGTNTQGVITYNVYAKIDKADPRIKSGMTANVEIATETVENALSVPNSAVKLYQGGRAVQVLENGQPKYIPVKVGIRGDARTQILEGVSENQEIIVGARNELIQREGGFGF